MWLWVLYNGSALSLAHPAWSLLLWFSLLRLSSTSLLVLRVRSLLAARLLAARALLRWLCDGWRHGHVFGREWLMAVISFLVLSVDSNESLFWMLSSVSLTQQLEWLLRCHVMSWFCVPELPYKYHFCCQGIYWDMVGENELTKQGQKESSCLSGSFPFSQNGPTMPSWPTGGFQILTISLPLPTSHYLLTKAYLCIRF